MVVQIKFEEVTNMNRHSSFDLIVEKVEKCTVVFCLAVLSLVYLSVELEDSLKDQTSSTVDIVISNKKETLSYAIITNNIV